MTSSEFTFWLQGFLEIENPETISKEKIQIIKDHLALVFNKVTPIYDNHGTVSMPSNPHTTGSPGWPFGNPTQIILGTAPSATFYCKSGSCGTTTCYPNGSVVSNT